MIYRFKNYLFRTIFKKEVKKIMERIAEQENQIDNLKERIRFLTTYKN